MATITVREFKNAKSLEIFMNGGLELGPVPNFSTGGHPTFGYLVGKTVIFILPTPVTVTFVAGDFADVYKPTFKEVRAKLMSAVADLRVFQHDQSMCFIEIAPSTGVSLDKDGTANAVLGLPTGVDTANTVHPSSELKAFAARSDKSLVVVLEA